MPAATEPLLPNTQSRAPTWPWAESVCVLAVGAAGPLSAWLRAPDVVVASITLAGLLILAIALAAVIESLAHMVGDVRGSIITASLANVVELVLSLVALRNGMLRFVQVNLLGTVLTSCLLIPGLSFLVRGLKEPRDKLNKHAGAMVSTVLLLASLAYTATTAYNVTTKHKPHCRQYCDVYQVVGISRLVAIVLLSCYAIMLVWSTSTHSHLVAKRRSRYKLHKPYSSNDSTAPVPAPAPVALPGVGISSAILLVEVVVLMLLVVMCSDALVGSLDGATKGLGFSRHFIALVMVPNVGGMDAIVTASCLAVKGHVDLALGFAVGTAIQILIGVLPLLVLVGWAVGQPLILDLREFEVVLLLLCVLTVNGIVRRASATYLEGAMMIGAYVVVAITYFYRSHDEEYGIRGKGTLCLCGEACCMPLNQSMAEPL
uniref:Sodium/calcium exchanger membrane region domain-containing protein n=1 Tax=Coccolithus braarudii TaxID=221442 RepID=A0A7S0Q366_9EUKA|mmetsp:Transcript_37385/g.79663  ORF Transcript_37385/g.79663 Transcript_37385/m.79663 type:complete len:431 (+) Transcript_37385:74-1366(+)|eukprot:CAMPEP_0183336574 /NCGR_PEP_ID=MMETSP0164_2-20130417/4512_1 /TAXON_ID=221442 /ORGANISM="Coccolithus pelagicus ssp braarudi, Strain PLY182g" /LENGTH=430 /DNA_ID=CAMNT_0025506119 /DNA_START=42 /DNA_END=1334 /DNA_ORIENTATION=-